jgi:hypothetical protein
MISLEQRISNLKKLLIETEKIMPPVNESVILPIKKLIRRHEVELIQRDYFYKECWFGYFLLQSQIIEEQLREIIRSAELLLKKERKAAILSPKITLEKLTLGTLLEEIRKYIDYQPLFDSLDKFNKNRKRIIHHLIDDYSSDINFLEREISLKFSPDIITYILTQTFEVSRRISERMITNENKALTKNIRNAFKAATGLANESILFRF